jgi:hypothetical protein
LANDTGENSVNYFVKEYQNGEAKTAGVKARDDIEELLVRKGFSPVEVKYNNRARINSKGLAKLMGHLTVCQVWKDGMKNMKQGDVVFVQFPVAAHSVLLSREFRRLKKRGIQIILLIHDLDMLRQAKSKHSSFANKIRINLEERELLKYSDKIIVHNEKMKDYMLEFGFKKEQLFVLKIFDYLIPGFSQEKTKPNTKDAPVIIAGTLKPHKAKYAYDLPDNCRFNLFGIGYEGEQKENVSYFGSFLPDELPFVLEGSVGLVWDGESGETCTGSHGEYLRVNNPHKTSLYLAAGIPVVIWKEAALADFVTENKCGITVSSLKEISGVLKDLTEEQYQDLLRNTMVVSEKLRTGYYFNTVLDSVCS